MRIFENIEKRRERKERQREERKKKERRKGKRVGKRRERERKNAHITMHCKLTFGKKEKKVSYG